MVSVVEVAETDGFLPHLFKIGESVAGIKPFLNIIVELLDYAVSPRLGRRDEIGVIPFEMATLSNSPKLRGCLCLLLPLKDNSLSICRKSGN
jgi:hypothetical protein